MASPPPSGPYFGPGSGPQPQEPLGYPGDDPWGEPVYVPEPPPYGYPGYPGYPSGAGPGVPPYPGSWYGPPPAPAAKVTAPMLGWLLVGAAALSVLGAVLPWATVFGLDIAGTEGDGQLVVGCAIVIFVCGLVIGAGRGRLWAALTALAFGLLIALIGLVDALNVNSIVSAADLPLDDAASIGGGLWLTLVAGLLASGIAAVAALRRDPVPPHPPPPPR